MVIIQQRDITLNLVKRDRIIKSSGDMGLLHLNQLSKNYSVPLTVTGYAPARNTGNGENRTNI